MAYAYPVIANGRLYIRDPGALWVYDIKAIRLTLIQAGIEPHCWGSLRMLQNCSDFFVLRIAGLV